MAFNLESLLGPPEHMQRCSEFVYQVELLQERMRGCDIFVNNETEDKLAWTGFSNLPEPLKNIINRNPRAKEIFIRRMTEQADEADAGSVNEAIATVFIFAHSTDPRDMVIVHAAAEEICTIAETYDGKTFRLEDPEDLTGGSPFGNIYTADGKKVALDMNADEGEEEELFSLDLRVHFHAQP